MTDIIERLRAPFAVTEQDAQEAVAEITRLRARNACLQADNNALKEEVERQRKQAHDDLEVLRAEFVEMQTRLILDTAEIISAMKLKNKKLPDGFDEETVLKIIARCAPGGGNE